jgi:hypothetical protein
MPWSRRPQGPQLNNGAGEDQARRRAVFSELREKLPALRAFFVLGPGGDTLDCVGHSPGFDVPNFASEYGTLVRIVQRACRDAGMGGLQEQILISSSAVILVYHLPNAHSAVFVCSAREHLGRLRYELKRSLLYSTFSNL